MLSMKIQILMAVWLQNVIRAPQYIDLLNIVTMFKCDVYSQVYLIAKDCQATFQNSAAHQNAKCNHFFFKKEINKLSAQCQT